MKTLMLLRHAKSSWDDPGLVDRDRPLAKRGKKAAPQMGRLLAKRGFVPDRIVSSEARRARDTAEAIAKNSGYAGDVELAETLYLATAGEILAFAQDGTPEEVNRLLLVGHNPGMEDLVAILCGRKERFPTAALAVFELDIESWKSLELGVGARLVALLRPKELD